MPFRQFLEVKKWFNVKNCQRLSKKGQFQSCLKFTNKPRTKRVLTVLGRYLNRHELVPALHRKSSRQSLLGACYTALHPMLAGLPKVGHVYKRIAVRPLGLGTEELLARFHRVVSGVVRTSRGFAAGHHLVRVTELAFGLDDFTIGENEIVELFIVCVSCSTKRWQVTKVNVNKLRFISSHLQLER